MTAPSRTALSVNLNKVALVRNTRHLGIPSVTRAAQLCSSAVKLEVRRYGDVWLREAAAWAWRVKLKTSLTLDLMGEMRERAEAEAGDSNEGPMRRLTVRLNPKELGQFASLS